MASLPLVNQVSPVAQVPLVLPDAQAIQVEKVYPATQAHKETAAHKDHPGMEETTVPQVKMVNQVPREHATSVHQRVWPLATKFSTGISTIILYFLTNHQTNRLIIRRIVAI